MEGKNVGHKTFSEKMKALMNEGKSEEAVQRIAKELGKEPDNDALHYLIGNAYRKLNNWQKALEHYAEAVSLNPDSPARQAKNMLTDILEYRCKDLLNP